MTISEYACDACGYTYEGCGGLGLLMSGEGRQTVSCAACQALHDVPLGVNLRKEPAEQARRKKHRKRTTTMEERLAALLFTCPVDASHPVRPWTDGEAGMSVPGAIVARCPQCDGQVRPLRAVLEMD